MNELLLPPLLRDKRKPTGLFRLPTRSIVRLRGYVSSDPDFLALRAPTTVVVRVVIVGKMIKMNVFRT